MQFRDLKKQYQVLKKPMDEAISKVLEASNYISGAQVAELEEKLAAYVGVKHCITCGNGTDALTLALMTWGIGEGDAVFVPDFTFFSSAETVAYEGATPVFVDVLEDTFNMDPDSLERAVKAVLAEGKLTPKVMVVVDLFGLPADYDRLQKIADQYGMYILEDGAQGFGGACKVLAMASNRRYDLNNPYDVVANGLYSEEDAANLSEEDRLNALNELWRNFCVSDTYEPGSTAKPITVAAALETGVVHDGDTFLCDGNQTVGGHTIWCAKKIGHGIIDLEGSLKFSCNDALMQIAAKLGEENYSKYQNLFNFGLRTGIDLPGEARTDSLIYYPSDTAPSENLIMGSTDLATNSFGQNFNVTMIQMVSAFSATINGGYYYQPHVVKKILSSDGGTVKNVEPVLLRTPISTKTSALIRRYLYNTMYGPQDANGNNATGRGARIAGYAMGGKTGTAEKIPRDKTNYVVSFIGFAPVDHPQVVLYVVVDEPNAVKQSTSSFAQEIWKNIMKEALPYLNIYPTEEIPDDMKDEVEAEQKAAEEAAAAEESSEESEDQQEEGTVVDPQTGETVTMPDPDTVDQADDSVLGDSPVNENLVDTQPENATEEPQDDNPTE